MEQALREARREENYHAANAFSLLLSRLEMWKATVEDSKAGAQPVNVDERVRWHSTQDTVEMSINCRQMSIQTLFTMHIVSFMTREELEKRIEELARKHAETHVEEVKKELEELSRRVSDMRNRLV